MSGLDELQNELAEALVEELLSPLGTGQSALWNLTGAVGSGKSTTLRLVETKLRESKSLIPIHLQAPGEVDSAPIAILSAATQLKAHQMLNGELERICDPRLTLAEKLTALGPTLEKHRNDVVLICDEPLYWQRKEWGDSQNLGRWLVREVPCRRLISGRLPTSDNPDRVARVKVGPADSVFARHAAPKQLTCALEQLIQSEPCTPGEFKLSLALTRYRSPQEVAEQLQPYISMGPLLDDFLQLLDRDPDGHTLRATLARLTQSRTPVCPIVFKQLLDKLNDFDQAIVEFSLCEALPTGFRLHPLVRQKVRERMTKAPWRLSPEELGNIHATLRQLFQQCPADDLLGQVESLHHELLSERSLPSKRPDRRIMFVEQLHAIGRTCSRLYRNHKRAAEIFDWAITISPQDSYGHHYLAFNLDWLAESPERVENHYQEAIKLRPSHPWGWSRWISYLATRGRFAEARENWGRALNALSISDTSPDWIFLSLHRWVARWLLHWGELDFAEAVLHAIPRRLRHGDTSLQALTNLLKALRVAEYEPGVFPLDIPHDRWWLPNGHTGLPLRWGESIRQRWQPARVESIDADSLTLVVAEWPEQPTDELVYHEREMTRTELQDAAHNFHWDEVHEGSFLELGYYGNEEALRIGLHRHKDGIPDLIPLTPPPDRWYKRSVNEASEDARP